MVERDIHSLSSLQADIKKLFESRTAFFKPGEVKKRICDPDVRSLFNYKVRFALLTNYTAESIEAGIICQLAMMGVYADGYICNYDRWADDIADSNSDFYSFRPDFVVLHLATAGITNCGCWRPHDLFERIEAASGILKQMGVPILLVLPEALELEKRPGNHWSAWRRQLCERMENLARISGFEIADLTPVLIAFGSAAYASQYWFSAKLPFHPSFFNHLSELIARHVKASVLRPIKLIAVDLDNTLWGGIVGEAGSANLLLDSFTSGGPYIRLQRWLKDFAVRGGLLAVVSKNNPADAEQVFAEHDQMPLQLSDFVDIRINWVDKHINIMEIARNLNIGLQSIAFIDDSMFERGLVRKECPEVTVIDFARVEELPAMLDAMSVFDCPANTHEESRNKLEEYRIRQQVKAAEGTFSSKDDFLRSLQTKVRALRIDESNIKRVAELVGKTNQFNMTTRRLSVSELLELGKKSDVYAYCFKTCDIYGDTGITAVLTASPVGKTKTWEITLWLQSCRVMGREIEKTHFMHLLTWLREVGAREVIGRYMPTAKNAPVADLYEKLGMALQTEDSFGKTYRASLDGLSVSVFAELEI